VARHRWNEVSGTPGVLLQCADFRRGKAIENGVLSAAISPFRNDRRPKSEGCVGPTQKRVRGTGLAALGKLSHLVGHLEPLRSVHPDDGVYGNPVRSLRVGSQRRAMESPASHEVTEQRRRPAHLPHRGPPQRHGAFLNSSRNLLPRKDGGLKSAIPPCRIGSTTSATLHMRPGTSYPSPENGNLSLEPQNLIPESGARSCNAFLNSSSWPR